MKKTVLLLTGALFIAAQLIPGNGFAQTPIAFNEISFLMNETGLGARALGVAGAYSALGDDYASLYWNPAGLALIGTHELYGALTHVSNNLKTSFMNVSADNTNSATSLNAIGIAYKADVHQGSLSIAFGYNKVHNYNSLFSYTGFNTGPSFVGAEFAEPYAPDNLVEDEYVDLGGDLAQYSFGVSIEIAKDFYLGSAFNIWSGGNIYSQVFQEVDSRNIYTVMPNDLERYKRETIIDTDIFGYGLTIGALFQYSDRIRFSGSLQTPRYLRLTERWEFSEGIWFDNNDYWLEEDYGAFEFNVKTPFFLGAGMAYTTGTFSLATDIEFIDWTQFNFRDYFPIDGMSAVQGNHNIRRTLRAITSPKLGLEYRIAGTSAIVRAGLCLVPHPLKDADKNMDKKIMTAGLGFDLSPTIDFNVAYRRCWWSTTSVSDLTGIPIGEDHVNNHVFTAFTISF
ncbi:OmpP1/FadL family transporter [candidate division KSB1 bacterium]